MSTGNGAVENGVTVGVGVALVDRVPLRGHLPPLLRREFGHVDVACNLGVHRRQVQAIGCRKRRPEEIGPAYHWWSFAAAANDAGAQYNLGTLLRRGEGVQQDFAQAARWFRQAAQRGHVQAQHDLGMLYYEGQGVDKDARWAYYWIKVAALQGDDKAEESLKKVAAGMSADQIREADRQAAEWMAKAKKILK